ncbi:helix-hairpin-helix domain-containing protein [Thiobacillus sp.]|uniref:helix-hairpin-helix domain-containing protein n=1 Tax=Thiobacillus sp. TaxID=924 RepID=UPI0017FC7FF3|nr:helix-hairpin-helix domain-containing protein [Thiobacillus sp.]MBC2729753.1 mitomycin resistance protein [Thiobacillus sp.]MBC2738488.1 helix-hairpin-helix domain-containing protein [Thiobacillus sp.]MBC2761232.1 helix-hairpin-helix domain-containing protein [Thiobacillus sp.]
MSPAKVKRARVHRLTDLPNVGPATAMDLEFIGISAPKQLSGKDPLKLYRRLCSKRGARQDPCVLDVFISITRFMSGDEPRPWWTYTEERKRRYGPV